MTSVYLELAGRQKTCPSMTSFTGDRSGDLPPRPEAWHRWFTLWNNSSRSRRPRRSVAYRCVCRRRAQRARADEGTRREHHRGHGRPPAVTRLRPIPPVCAISVVDGKEGVDSVVVVVGSSRPRRRRGRHSYLWLSAKTTTHPALIPQEVGGNSRPHPRIPATPALKRPAHRGNPRLSPLSSQAHDRPVTPEVAGSSPVAPVFQSACK
jgi:hypothetical protein